jgi:hypothetical protein
LRSKKESLSDVHSHCCLIFYDVAPLKVPGQPEHPYLFANLQAAKAGGAGATQTNETTGVTREIRRYESGAADPTPAVLDQTDGGTNVKIGHGGAAAAAGVHARLTLGFDHRSQWQSTDKNGMDDAKLFAVASGSDERTKIEAEFKKTLPFLEVDLIERVENGYQHESFSVHGKAIRANCGLAFDEGTMKRLLFHGTGAVEAIVNDLVAGFLPLLSGSVTGAIYGDGTYFARDAKYSDDYAKRLPNGQKQMLLVEVVVGRWTKGGRGMKMCPLLPGEKYKRYDSLVDNPADPTIFVVQHSSQAYPAYLITYH